MYLHIGENKIVRKCDIVGIFDSDTCTVSRVTRDFLKSCAKSGKLETVGDLPKSFIIVKNKNGEKIYFSQLSSKTLAGRALGEENNRKDEK